MTLLVLCLAALAVIAPTTSVIVGLSVPMLDHFSARLPARMATRLWLGLALVPWLVAIIALGAALLPALGLSPDHCLAHGDHHLHLCPYHPSGSPSAALLVLAGLVPARLGYLLWQCMTTARLGAHTARCLRDGGREQDDVCVFANSTPEAFVLGCIGPQIFVSEGLRQLGPDVYRAAVAHERDHVAHLDAAWRLGFPLVAAGHLPWITTLLQRRLAGCQELAADAAAARSAGGPLGIAEALLQVARSAALGRQPLIGFAHGNVEHRVRALLEPSPPATPRLLITALGFGFALLTCAALSHHEIHHGLESLLGQLHHH